MAVILREASMMAKPLMPPHLTSPPKKARGRGRLMHFYELTGVV